ncbi:reverse transcriptase [Tanacetum coccineum]
MVMVMRVNSCWVDGDGSMVVVMRVNGSWVNGGGDVGQQLLGLCGGGGGVRRRRWLEELVVVMVSGGGRRIFKVVSAGLPTELEMSVRMFKPATLVDAYSLTRLQEAILDAVKKKNKPSGSFNSNRFGNGGNYGNVSKPAILPKPNTPVNTPMIRKKTGIPWAFRNCSLKSLNALTGTNNFQTMRVIGTVGKHLVHILVDCGSTHNFLDKNMAKKLGCSIKPTGPLAVTLTDGNNLVTTSKCKNFKGF